MKFQQKIEKYYREVFFDRQVEEEENEQLIKMFEEANPPPDLLVWLRTTAFRISSEFLSEQKKENVSILRCVNTVVHSLEHTCMSPKMNSSSKTEVESDLETEFVSMYNEMFRGLIVDEEKCHSFKEFILHKPLTPAQFMKFRALAFRTGCEYLSDDVEKNISLMKCINAIVHNLEMVYLVPKPYKLKQEVCVKESVKYIGLNASIEKAIQHLWKLDINRLIPGEDYVLNVQEGKNPYYKRDVADDPLFKNVVEKNFIYRPTYKTFIALLDNYEADVKDNDFLTKSERVEVSKFLDCIMQTAPMQFCHKYCCANKSDVPKSIDGFKRLLYDIWFVMYSRYHGKRSSSGFEHVFVGEIKNDAVTGFHNWIQFYIEEKKGNVDYKGYVKPRNEADVTNDDDHVLTLQFSWNGVDKFMSTTFIGVSPEFEMALYTMCFLIGEEENIVKLDTGADVFLLKVCCHKISREKIGSCFVEALSHYENN